MKRLYGVFLIWTLLVSTSAWAQKVVQGEYLIKFKSSARSAASIQRKLQGKAALKSSFPALGIHQIQLKAGEAAQMSLDDLQADPDIEYVEPNYVLEKFDSGASDVERSSYEDLVTSAAVSTSPDQYSQSAANVGIKESWVEMTPLSHYGTKVVVAVVDTGLDRTHTVFKPYDGSNTGGTGALWVNQAEANGLPGVDDDQNGYVDDINGWNFINNTNNFLDDDDHGTHVAGIVVGAGLNIFARPLEESRVQIMPLKFLGAGGSGSTSNAIRAIYYAVNNGARVINNSWGGTSYSKALHDALTYAYDHQVLVVSAAGNYASNNDSTPIYPSNYQVPSNLSVASISRYDELSSFSNYGASYVSIASPGEYIESTVPGNKTLKMSGTSMATPLVAGLAGLAFREAPNLTGYQMKQLIEGSLRSVPKLQGVVRTGGRIDAFYLIQTSKQMVGTLSSQPSYTPVYGADRSLASESAGGGAGGCGMVREIVRNGPGSGNESGSGGTTNPGVLIILGLALAPFIVLQVLRSREPKSRRKYERFRMNSEIKVMVGDRELVGNMNTISEGGLSFNVDQALEKGGIVTMRVQSPDGREVIEVQGQVVWSEANQAYGVQFANAKQGTLAMIRDWTSGLLKA